MNRNEYAKDPKTWFGLNRPDMDVNDADAVVFGIPFEGGVSYRAGTAEAPDTLRANTTHATPCSEQLAFFKDFDVVDAGNAEGGRDEMFADVQALTAEWIARQGKLEKKLYKVPEEIDDAIAVVKLAAMGIKIDTLTEAQREYLSGWQV